MPNVSLWLSLTVQFDGGCGLLRIRQLHKAHRGYVASDSQTLAGDKNLNGLCDSRCATDHFHFLLHSWLLLCHGNLMGATELALHSGCGQAQGGTEQ